MTIASMHLTHYNKMPHVGFEAVTSSTENGTHSLIFFLICLFCIVLTSNLDRSEMNSPEFSISLWDDCQSKVSLPNKIKTAESVRSTSVWGDLILIRFLIPPLVKLLMHYFASASSAPIS